VRATRLAAEIERLRQEEIAKLPPPPPTDLDQAIQFYWVVKLFLGIGAAVALGITVINLDGPGTTAAGIGAIIAGVGVCILAVLAIRRR
jgi:hypothetical protein